MMAEATSDKACAEDTGADPYATLAGPSAPPNSADPYQTLAHSDATPLHDWESTDLATTQPGSARSTVAVPTLPNYQIIRELGRGGMGVVYHARQRNLQREVALKMILSGAHAGHEELARFQLEADAVAKLQHPNIVQIYEIGSSNGLPYFSLEYLEGGSLESKVKGTPQAGTQAARWVESISRAMFYAHEHGIIHRDLKPANILLTADGSPKITDFGLAKRLYQEGATASNAVMGTPNYMAPEQARGETKQVGPAADIYALGAILYDLLTGRPPFKAASALDTLQQVIDLEPVAPSRLVPELAKDLETICLKCLDKQPDRRYSTAEGLADDLARFRRGEPILARPIATWERFVKWARRRPVTAALAIMSAVAVASLVVVGFLAAGYERRGRRAAEQEARLSEQEMRSELRFEAAKGNVLAQLMKAEQDLREGDTAAVQLALSRILGALDDEPRLNEFRSRAEALGKEVDDRARDTEVHRKFLELRDAAMFHQSQFTGLDADQNLSAMRAAARLALSTVLGNQDAIPNPMPWLNALPKSSLTKEQKEELKTGVYEILLLLSDAVGKTIEKENPKANAETALTILDRAMELRPATQAVHYRRATFQTQKGDLAAAGTEKAIADKIKPGDASDFFLLGEAAYQQEDLQRAISCFKQALRLEPRHFWANYLLAVCSIRLQRPDYAEMNLTACQALRPGFIWTYVLRGLVHGELGHRAQLLHRPKDAHEQFELAEADFAQALSRQPNNEAMYSLLVNRGTVRFRREQFEQAVRDFQDALKRSPKPFSAFVNLAQVYQDMHRDKEAIAALDAAIRLKPTFAALYRSRGRLHLAMKDPAAAIGDFTKALQVADAKDPQSADDLAELGRLHYEKRDFPAALRDFSSALKISPKQLQALRGRAILRLEQKKYPDAVSDLTEYLKQGKPSAEIYEARGLAFTKLEKFPEAVLDFTRALEMDGEKAHLNAYRAWAELASDAPAQAIRDFDAALLTQVNQPEWLAGRAFAKAKLGMVREAIADADAAVRISNGSDQVKLQTVVAFQELVKRIDANPKIATPNQRAYCQDRANFLAQQLPASAR